MNISQYSLNAALAQEGAETVERLPSLRELYLGVDAEAEVLAPGEAAAGRADAQEGKRGAHVVAGDASRFLDGPVASTGTFAAWEDGGNAQGEQGDQSAGPAAVYEFSVLEEGGAVVDRCESDASFLRVPERLGGHDVVGVGSHAFSTCYALEEVVLPEALMEIGRHAFMNTALRGVRMPGALRVIGKSAFFRCEKLEAAQLNDGLLCIGVDAFRESGLTRLSVPASVAELGRNAFKNTQLKVAGPERSLQIDPGNERFLLEDGCLYRRRTRGAESGLVLLQALDEGMERYVGPAGLVRVAGNAFAGLKRLSRVVLPEGTRAIADRAFRGCMSLERVDLPDSLRHIGKQAFGETQVRELRIPAALESLGPAALFTGGTVARSFERSIRRVQVASGNELFHLEDGLLCQRLPEGGDAAVLYVGNADAIIVPRSVRVIGPYAYMNAGPVRLLRLHSGIHTVDVGGLDFGCGIPVVEFDEIAADGTERRYAVRFPSGEAGRQATQMAFGRGLFDLRYAYAVADNAIMVTQDVYVRSRVMLERLADPMELKPQTRGLFEKRLATTACQAAVEFGRNGFLQGVDLLLDVGALGAENIDDAIAMASREGEVAVLSRLLEAKRTRFEAPMFDFDL